MSLKQFSMKKQDIRKSLAVEMQLRKLQSYCSEILAKLGVCLSTVAHMYMLIYQYHFDI